MIEIRREHVKPVFPIPPLLITASYTPSNRPSDTYTLTRSNISK